VAKPPVYYADYLCLEQLLSSQKLVSGRGDSPAAHDETLFIVVHQVYELWFKQILHELSAVSTLFAQNTVHESTLGSCVAHFERIVEIQKLLISQLGVMETMTPLDFLDFRDYLVPASGFQSVQFRAIEIRLGLKISERKGITAKSFLQRFNEADQKIIAKLESEDSLLTLIDRWLTRIPFLDFQGFHFWEKYQKAVASMLADDEQTIRQNPTLSQDEINLNLAELTETKNTFEVLFDEKKYQSGLGNQQSRFSHGATLSALFINLYRDEPILHLPFKLLNTLMEIDENFTTWRHRHALMAHRMLGGKIGTGGSSGHQYLKTAAENNRVFIDLFNLSTYLIPRSKLPQLPRSLKDNLNFHFSVDR